MAQSPYPELLSSNTVPRDFQIPVILCAIEAAENEVKGIETEFRGLGTLSDQAMKRRSELETFVRTHRSMLSAIRRLPSEILSEIFIHSVGKQDGCRPRLAACVCTRWRDVALSTPRLWCDIYLHEEEIRAQSLHSLLSLQLERSGQVPLSVVFSDPSDETSVLELLLTVSQRWQSLELNVAFHQHEHIRCSAASFPILKHLIIRITPSLDLGNLSRPLPLLEELTLSWPSCPIPHKLPWTGLTKCTLFHCSSSEVLNILRSSSHMETLSLHKCYCLNPVDPHSIMITSNIRTLTISRCSGAFNHDFVARLAAPKLKELIIDDFDDNTVTTQITSLVAGSSGLITHLSLCGIRLSERELISVLQVADMLVHFEISWPWDVHSDTLMEELTILPGKRTRNLLPKLRKLSITGGLSCSDDSLLAMLRSRCPGLQHVELYYAGRTFFFDHHLDGLRRAGMEIILRLEGPCDPFAGKNTELEGG
ncbi:hypothetical protein B0H11DRAFT_1867745 [Mycena galericulata]|nr:hypothetical protein B0H11DRAFT_1369581 [Mycena galericulata]KAJ7471561.1 hypothetical protein B0H11DRAFT_1867745 [Mycena galericulata]